MTEPVRKVVILGSGCAGLTAALYAARAGLEPVVVEGPQTGGLLTLTNLVENYPGFPDGVLGPELMDRMREQARNFGAVIEAATVESVDLSTRPFRIRSDAGTWSARTLILATGSSPRMLGLPAEKKLLGRGLSTCATCDGPFFRGQRVAVAGGGDSALEEALFLAQLASSVTIIHRRDVLRGSKIMQDRALANQKIRFEWNQVVEDILDVEQQKVTGVRLRDVRSGEQKDLAVEGFFVAIGHVPNTSFLANEIELNAKGYIQTRPGTSQTSVPGVFAAGDVQDERYRQAVTAAGSGCMAAIDATRFLTDEGG